jgi:hypothetical protein
MPRESRFTFKKRRSKQLDRYVSVAKHSIIHPHVRDFAADDTSQNGRLHEIRPKNGFQSRKKDILMNFRERWLIFGLNHQQIKPESVSRSLSRLVLFMNAITKQFACHPCRGQFEKAVDFGSRKETVHCCRSRVNCWKKTISSIEDVSSHFS